MKKVSIIKKLIIGILAITVSVGLMLSIPMVQFLQNRQSKSNDQKIVAKVSVQKIVKDKKKEKPKRKLKKPKVKKPSRTQLKSGPRFAMDLSVAGTKGVAVSLELTNRSGGGQESDGDVDVKPKPNFPPPFRVPVEIKKSEENAMAILSFCVDGMGRAYDIKVVAEKPAGLGMAQSGRKALAKTRFSPALKEGDPVSFCGLEQPFEVKFND